MAPAEALENGHCFLSPVVPPPLPFSFLPPVAGQEPISSSNSAGGFVHCHLWVQLCSFPALCLTDMQSTSEAPCSRPVLCQLSLVLKKLPHFLGLFSHQPCLSLCHHRTCFLYFWLSYLWRSPLLLSWWTHEGKHLEGFSSVISWSNSHYCGPGICAQNLGDFIMLSQGEVCCSPCSPMCLSPWWTLDVQPES